MIKLDTALQTIVIATIATGCATSSVDDKEGRSIVGGREQHTRQPATATPASRSVADNPTGKITLEQALRLALAQNLDLAAAAHEAKAETALSRQAGKLPNPELEAEIGEYDRDGAGFESSETSLALVVPIEMGGKRRARRTAADNSAQAATIEYESKKLEVTAETTQSFIAVAAARERLKLARAMGELTKEVHNAVSERVKAGKEISFQSARTKGEVELANIGTYEAASSLALAKRKLASMWGADAAAFEDVDAKLTVHQNKLPALDELRRELAHAPAIRRCEARIRMQQALLRGEKSVIIPDLTASVGMAQYEEDGTSSMIFGIGIPLPILDTNNGNVSAAKQALLKAEVERKATAIALATELAEVYAALDAALKRAQALEKHVVPAAESAFNAIRKGYTAGKFRLLEMLEAQQELYEAKTAELDARLEAGNALADIERVVGKKLTGIEKQKEKK